jgi:hypothetical protein
MLKIQAAGAPPDRIGPREPDKTVHFAIGEVVEEQLRAMNPKYPGPQLR